MAGQEGEPEPFDTLAEGGVDLGRVGGRGIAAEAVAAVGLFDLQRQHPRADGREQPFRRLLRRGRGKEHAASLGKERAGRIDQRVRDRLGLLQGFAWQVEAAEDQDIELARRQPLGHLGDEAGLQGEALIDQGLHRQFGVQARFG